LVDHLWQSTVVALLALLLLAVFRTMLSARARGAIAWIALLKFAIPSALLFPHLPVPALFHFAPAGEAVPTVQGDAERKFPLGGQAISGHRSETGLSLCLAVWAAGAGAILLMAALRAHRKPSGGMPDEKTLPVSAMLAWLAPAAGLRSSPPVCLVAPETGPAVLGIIHPTLLLPAGLEHSLTPLELRAVLLHELEHLRRRDNLWATVRVPFLAAFWFHPLVWILSQRIGLEAEMACDEAVLAQGVESQTYVAALAKTVRYCMGLLPTNAAAAGTTPLGARLANILAYRGAQPWRRLTVALPLLAAFATTFALSTYAGSITAPAAGGTGPIFAQGNSQLSPASQGSEKSTVLRIVPAPGDLSEPFPLACPLPIYPSVLRSAGVSGEVTMGFTVGEDGLVHEPYVEAYDSPEFAAAATNAVLSWRYRPAEAQGKPIETQLRIQIVFAATEVPSSQPTAERPVTVSLRSL
jgi:TonB family protein